MSRDGGGEGVAEPRWLSRLRKRFVSRLLRATFQPSLGEYYEGAELQTFDVGRIAERIREDPRFACAPGTPAPPELLAEASAVVTELERARARTRLRFPTTYWMTPSEASLLYLLVRTLRPERVVESGVADGFSTVVLLTALEKNGRGRLTSLDVSAEVGVLAKGRPSERWELRLMAPTREAFAAEVRRVGTVGLFVHDSDHSYAVQTAEYEVVRPRLEAPGVIVSDDIDASYAFLDFCARERVRPFVLVTERKLMGFVPLAPRKTTTGGASSRASPS